MDVLAIAFLRLAENDSLPTFLSEEFGYGHGNAWDETTF